MMQQGSTYIERGRPVTLLLVDWTRPAQRPHPPRRRHPRRAPIPRPPQAETMKPLTGSCTRQAACG